MNGARMRAFLFTLLLSLPAAAQQIPEEARREGVTAEELPRWEAVRRNRLIGLPALISIDWSTFTVPPAVDPCPNRGFESNNWTSWHTMVGTRINTTGGVLALSPSPAICTPAAATSRHCILPGPSWWVPPSDPIITQSPKIFIPFPNGGARSARIGNAMNGAEGEAVYQVFTVTPANAELVYRYALVLQDPGHVASAQPFFGAYVYDVTTSSSSPPLLAFKQRVASGTDPFFHNTNFGTQWREVSCERIDLTPWMGRKVMVVFASADCAYGGHYGYSYLDGKCGAPDPPALTLKRAYCPNETVLGVASTTDPATSYTWTVVETTNALGTIPVTGTQATETFTGALPSTPRDLTAWYVSKGQQFRCNRYYRVTLTVTTECQTNQSVSRVIFISCPAPPVISGPIDTCAPGQYCIQPRRGETYSWTVTGGTPTTGSGSCINVTWGTTGPYAITVTSTNIWGCKATTKITIQPCRCCREVRLTTSHPQLTGGSNGLLTFTLPLTLTNFTPVTAVTATLISATTTPSSTSCGTAGPVLATIPGGTTPAGWNGPLLNGLPTNEISWTHSTGTPLSGVAFPFQIQLPPAPTPPCSETIRVCVKFSFTGPVGPAGICRTCTFTRCFTFIRSGDVIRWPTDIPDEPPPPVDD